MTHWVFMMFPMDFALNSLVVRISLTFAAQALVFILHGDRR